MVIDFGGNINDGDSEREEKDFPQICGLIEIADTETFGDIDAGGKDENRSDCHEGNDDKADFFTEARTFFYFECTYCCFRHFLTTDYTDFH